MMKYSMKKRFLCILLLLTGALCACQPTPEREAVVNKGDGVLEQRIAEAREQERMEKTEEHSSDASPASTPAPAPYIYPESWQEDIDLTNFLVHIDVKKGGMEVPAAPYPIIRLSQGNFREMGDALSALMELVMPQRVRKREGFYSYEDYQKALSLYALEQYDDELEEYRPFTAEEQKEAEKEMEELYGLMKTAPRQNEFTMDGDLDLSVNTEYTYGTEDGTLWYVSISENAFSISKSQRTVYPENYFIDVRSLKDGSFPTPYPHIVISQEEAEREAARVAEAFSLQQWRLEKTERAALRKKYCNLVEEERTMGQGYWFTYARKIGDTGFFNYKDRSGERLHFEETAYAASLQFETLCVYVDENGIGCITWENPIIVEETLAGNVELLPFEDIQTIFVQTMKNGLSWTAERPPSNGKLNPTRIGWVEHIKLAYAYIQEKDSPGKYLAVPTWFFIYRTEAVINANASGYLVYPDIIAINAVDGTRIEL